MTKDEITNERYQREMAFISAWTFRMIYADHLAGRARIGGLDDEKARRLRDDAQDRLKQIRLARKA